MLKDGIVNGVLLTVNGKKREMVRSSVYQKKWDLNNAALHNGVLYKTHDYPPENRLKNNVRILYIYSDPVDVILSLLRLYDVQGEEWMKTHYKHLRVSFTDFKRIIYEDQLQLENHLQCWLEEERYRIAFIRYEKMWSHQDDISDFLGFKIDLPKHRKRTSKNFIDQSTIKSIEKSYKPLRTKVNALKDFFTNN